VELCSRNKNVPERKTPIVSIRPNVGVLFSAAEAFGHVGEATTGEQAVALAEELQPDVILMDFKMPGINGVEATRRILRTSPHIGILILTMFENDDSIFAAVCAGARGYLLKGADEDEITRAIQAVSHGEAIFSPPIAQKLMTYFARFRGESSDIFPDLTPREYEILTLLAKGYSNPQIAQELVLSARTVRNHVSNIFSKLQVSDRAQAIIRAREAGFGKDNA
jgi:DNA-binding NarL/FixJ family response regulator